jgi:hypothetical protein
VKGRRGRRRKQLLDDLKEARRYWKLKEQAEDRTLWRTQFGRCYGPVTRQDCYLICQDYGHVRCDTVVWRMGTKISDLFEMSVSLYQTIHHYIPED